MGHKRAVVKEPGAEEIQQAINRYIQDAINEAEMLIKTLPDLSAQPNDQSSICGGSSIVSSRKPQSVKAAKKGKKKTAPSEKYEKYSVSDDSSVVSSRKKQASSPPQAIKKKAVEKCEVSSAKATINSSIQADVQSKGIKLTANLLVTKPDGEKQNIQVSCDMPNYKVDRVVVNGEEFRRVSA